MLAKAIFQACDHYCRVAVSSRKLVFPRVGSSAVSYHNGVEKWQASCQIWCKWYFIKSDLNWLKLFLDWSVKKYVGHLSDLQNTAPKNWIFHHILWERFVGRHSLFIKSRWGFINMGICKLGSGRPQLIGRDSCAKWGEGKEVLE